MAAQLRKDPNLTVELVDGPRGEFTILADGKEIIFAGKLTRFGIHPSMAKIRKAIESEADRVD